MLRICGSIKSREWHAHTNHQMLSFNLFAFYLFYLVSSSILSDSYRFSTNFTSLLKTKIRKKTHEYLPKTIWLRFDWALSSSLGLRVAPANRCSYENIYKFLKTMSLFIMLLVNRFSCIIQWAEHLYSYSVDCINKRFGLHACFRIRNEQ